MELLLHYFFKCLASLPFTVNEIEAERRRQAQAFLKEGRLLLGKGWIDEADVRFELALRLWPSIVDSLSRKRQRSLMDEIVRYGGGWNAVELHGQLSNRLEGWEGRIEPNSAAKRALHKYLISRGLVVGFGVVVLLFINWMLSCFKKGGH